MVSNDWQAVLPDQLLQAGHLIRFTAEVDLSVDDPPPIEILAQCSAMLAPIGGENEDGIERDHPSHPHGLN